MTVFNATQQKVMIEGIKTFFKKYPAGKISLERYEEGRNEGQQGLLHVIIREIAKQAGCGEEYLKQKVLKNNEEGVFDKWPCDFEANLKGKRVLVPISESKLTKREESALIEELYAFAAEWGYSLEKVA